MVGVSGHGLAHQLQWLIQVLLQLVQMVCCFSLFFQQLCVFFAERPPSRQYLFCQRLESLLSEFSNNCVRNSKIPNSHYPCMFLRFFRIMLCCELAPSPALPILPQANQFRSFPNLPDGRQYPAHGGFSQSYQLGRSQNNRRWSGSSHHSRHVNNHNLGQGPVPRSNGPSNRPKSSVIPYRSRESHRSTTEGPSFSHLYDDISSSFHRSYHNFVTICFLVTELFSEPNFEEDGIKMITSVPQSNSASKYTVAFEAYVSFFE